MNDMSLHTDELRQGAEEFSQAGKELQEIVKHLDETTQALERKWSGASQQVFYQQYGELRQYVDGFTVLLANISKEMHAIAERFEKADR